MAITVAANLRGLERGTQVPEAGGRNYRVSMPRIRGRPGGVSDSISGAKLDSNQLGHLRPNKI